MLKACYKNISKFMTDVPSFCHGLIGIVETLHNYGCKFLTTKLLVWYFNTYFFYFFLRMNVLCVTIKIKDVDLNAAFFKCFHIGFLVPKGSENHEYFVLKRTWMSDIRKHDH